MDKNKIFQFIAKQKTAFIASVNEQGYPVMVLKSHLVNVMK